MTNSPVGGLVEVVVVCIGTSHPGNVGAIARGAANFGITDLRFVNPRCDVKDEHALARSVHARPNLEAAMVVDTLAEALVGTSLSVGTTARQTTATNRFLRKAMDVRDWADSLAQWDGKIAMVFGREDTGLTADEVNRLDQLVTVPTSNYSSLNLAHAVTILCYELFRVQHQERITEVRTLEPDTLAALTRAFDCITEETEGRPWRQDVAKGIFRKIIGRSNPSDYEIHNIMGILGNVLKRFNHPEWATENSKVFLAEQGLLVDGPEAGSQAEAASESGGPAFQSGGAASQSGGAASQSDGAVASEPVEAGASRAEGSADAGADGSFGAVADELQSFRGPIRSAGPVREEE